MKSGNKEKYLLCFLFILALVLRLVYILQLSRTPFFTNPIGDSTFYYQQAMNILSGDILWKEIYFHSSIFYPYFMALIFLASGHSFFILYLTQILIGSGNCIVIYYLTKKYCDNRLLPAFIGGLFAVFYGIFAFFDGDILMIFLTLFCVDLSILFLLQYIEKEKFKYVFFSGVLFAIGVLDKPNLLVCVPAILIFLITRLSFHPDKWYWKSSIIFLIGLFLLVLPVTLGNYIVDKDFVLVSSNGGLNFFIGNNPDAKGVYRIPAEYGLNDLRVYESARAVAEKSLGKPLKPSQISQFWFHKGLAFIENNPLKALKLYGRKILLLFNEYEIPNQMNFYYIRSNEASTLYLFPISFGLIVPLALAGIVWRLKEGLNLAGKLYLAFLISYAVSLIPFFITERYRLPMAPFFIVFAAGALSDIWQSLRENIRKAIYFWVPGLATTFIFVHLPFHPANYSFDRISVGLKWYELSISQIPPNQGDLNQAIVLYKWALESSPSLSYGHYDLGLAYEVDGYYSGALKEMQEAVRLDPGEESYLHALTRIQNETANRKDKISIEDIPKSPYETALSAEQQIQIERAEQMYQYIICKDPFHYLAFKRLELIYLRQGKNKKAQICLKKYQKLLQLLNDSGSAQKSL